MSLTFGTGKFGSNDLVIKRKFRWVFSGYDARGNELFNTFVKVISRPTANEFHIIQHCVMYDDPADAKRDIENTKFAIPRIEYGTLTLYDGCGVEIERYELDCVEAKIVLFDEIMDGADITVRVGYASVLIIPPPQ